MRMIDADSLKERMLAETPEHEKGVVDIFLEAVAAMIDEQPTIERKMGKWYKPNGVMPPEHFGRHRCSICDAFAMHDWKHHREQLTDYCPNCGADMRRHDEGTADYI